MKKIITVFLISLTSVIGTQAIANDKEEPRIISSTAIMSQLPAKDAYAYEMPFYMDKKQYKLRIFINEGKSILLFDNEDDKELYKAVVDHRKKGSYNFYGYKEIKGQIEVKNHVYHFSMKENNNKLGNFTVKIPEYDF